MHLVKIRQQGP